MKNKQQHRNGKWLAFVATGILLLGGMAGWTPVVAGPGYVDPEPFLDLGGDEDLALEISLSGALLKMISGGLAGADPDLAETVAGLRSIHAVILDLDTPEKRIKGSDLIRNAEKSLRKGRWDRVARVKDDEGRVSVWILSSEERVDGVTVLIHSQEDGEVVFVNIDGTIDLSRLKALGEKLDIPGLEGLQD
jgi:hypothetical protein